MEQVQAQSQQMLLNAMSEMQTQNRRQFQVLNNNIRCFGGRIEGSLVRQVNSNRQQRLLAMNEADEAAPMEAVNDAQLSSQTRDLITLWREYQFGLNGRKAARLFTTRERNANRQTNQTKIL
jgi:CBS-domain-containing membrane protein